MKLTLIALLTTIAMPAVAGHEPNGWRDTGCDEAANVEILGKSGNVLYLNNPTCPNAQGGMDAGHSAYVQPEDDEEVAEEDGPVEDEEVIVATKD